MNLIKHLIAAALVLACLVQLLPRTTAAPLAAAT